MCPNMTKETYAILRERSQLKGVIYNSYNQRYVKGWVFSSSLMNKGKDGDSVMIRFCDKAEEAQLIKKIDFEASFFMRNTNYHFRPHDPVPLLLPLSLLA